MLFGLFPDFETNDKKRSALSCEGSLWLRYGSNKKIYHFHMYARISNIYDVQCWQATNQECALNVQKCCLYMIIVRILKPLYGHDGQRAGLALSCRRILLLLHRLRVSFTRHSRRVRMRMCVTERWRQSWRLHWLQVRRVRLVIR